MSYYKNIIYFSKRKAMKIMEEKKQIKIKLKTFIIIFLVIAISTSIATFFILNNLNKQGNIAEKSISDTLKIKKYENKDYYIIKGDYSEEYDLQYINLSQYYDSRYNKVVKFEKKEVMDYSEYESFCNEWGLKKAYSDISKNYIVFSYKSYGTPILEARLASVEYSGNNANIYIWDDASGVAADISAYCIVIPTEKEIDNINIISVYTDEEFDNIVENGTPYDPSNISIDKPIIYLYPKEEIKVSVKLLNDEKITCSYPKYVDGWNVLAKPSGDLIDLDTERSLYSLYYESEGIENLRVSQEGFVVSGKESAKFLEEKLATLGLTEREAEEFIVYWLPKLESNKYNYIRFATDEEINTNIPLDITPKPDTIIRIMMIFKGLECPIEVEEQKLDTPQRTGFTVVEWGGTEL